MDKMKKEAGYLRDPHLGRGTKEFLKVLNAGDTPVESLAPDDARQVLVGAQASVEVDLSGIDERELWIDAGGFRLKLDLVRPEGVGGELPLFVFIHGGGWVLGDYPTHRRLVHDLVVASGCACVFVNYTPSPEAHFPQAVNEIYAAVGWVAEHGPEIGVDASRMAVVGNSVGGNMSVATSLRAAQEGGPALVAQVLLWPVTDPSDDWESYDLYGRERFLTAPLMRWMFDLYTTDPGARRDPRLASLKATREQLRAMPPTLIAVAENDILRDQGEAFGRLLDEAGVDVTTVRFNGVIHDWGMLNGLAHLPATRDLILLVAAVLRDKLCRP